MNHSAEILIVLMAELNACICGVIMPPLKGP